MNIPRHKVFKEIRVLVYEQEGHFPAMSDEAIESMTEAIEEDDQVLSGISLVTNRIEEFLKEHGLEKQFAVTNDI